MKHLQTKDKKLNQNEVPPPKAPLLIQNASVLGAPLHTMET